MPQFLKDDLGYNQYFYTQEELDKAVKEAYENSALICEYLISFSDETGVVRMECAEAIRKRGE